METQFTGKPGISGYNGNYSITTFTSISVQSGNTRKYGITRKGDCKMLEVMLNTSDN
jgi:hypothetical protein